MDVISPEGKVYPQEQDSTVRLKAELAYDEYQLGDRNVGYRKKSE